MRVLEGDVAVQLTVWSPEALNPVTGLVILTVGAVPVMATFPMGVPVESLTTMDVAPEVTGIDSAKVSAKTRSGPVAMSVPGPMGVKYLVYRARPEEFCSSMEYVPAPESEVPLRVSWKIGSNTTPVD